MRLGIPVEAFWEMTPREVIVALDAAAWRMHQKRIQMISLAWHTAALMRARRMPALAQMVARLKRPRQNEPIEKRREEFAELKAKMQDAVTRGADAVTRGRGDTPLQ